MRQGAVCLASGGRVCRLLEGDTGVLWGVGKLKKEFIKMKLSTEDGGAMTPPFTKTQWRGFTPFSFDDAGGSGKGARTI